MAATHKRAYEADLNDDQRKRYEAALERFGTTYRAHYDRGTPPHSAWPSRILDVTFDQSWKAWCLWCRRCIMRLFVVSEESVVMTRITYCNNSCRESHWKKWADLLMVYRRQPTQSGRTDALRHLVSLDALLEFDDFVGCRLPPNSHLVHKGFAPAFGADGKSCTQCGEKFICREGKPPARFDGTRTTGNGPSVFCSWDCYQFHTQLNRSTDVAKADILWESTYGVPPMPCQISLVACTACARKYVIPASEIKVEWICHRCVAVLAVQLAGGEPAEAEANQEAIEFNAERVYRILPDTFAEDPEPKRARVYEDLTQEEEIPATPNTQRAIVEWLAESDS